MNKEQIKLKLSVWIEEQRLQEYSSKTLIEYKNAVNKFINYIPTEEFVLSKQLTISYKEFLSDKFATASRNKYITILNKFLYYLGREDCKLLKIKTQQKTSIDDPIWEQEHKRMLRWAKALGMDDMYLIIKIFAYVGIRVQELKKFTVENADSNYIKVYIKGKERTLIVRNDLKREIKHYCKEHKIITGYIFRSPVMPEKMLNASTIWRRLKRIARAAKIDPHKIHPHAWRHLFAKAAKEAGMDLDELADVLGHSDIKTTRIYTMTSNREKKQKMENIKL